MSYSAFDWFGFGVLCVLLLGALWFIHMTGPGI